MNGKWIAGSVLLLAAGVILLVSIFVPWYTVSTSGSGPSFGINFQPNNQVVLTMGSQTVTTTYSTFHFNNTGALYGIVEAVVIVGAILGIAAGGLALALHVRPGWSKAVLACGVLALVFALAGPIVLLAAQPGALTTDIPRNGAGTGSGTGPQTSFFGSDTTSGGTLTWGPAYGWYLGIVAGILALAGSLLAWSSTRTSPESGSGDAATSSDSSAPAEGESPSSLGPPSLVCSVCQAAFWTPTQLDAHMANSHPGVPHSPSE